MSAELEEFRLIRPLGRGAMGVVYLGYDTVLRRAVAIKLIGSRDSSAASRERLLIEARAIARLSHPNIVTIYRVGATHDGRPFLVQELIRGESLDRVPRPMPWREVCKLAIGIARGLDAAHRRGILHCDVKPANVMLDEYSVPRLIDFGLAKLSTASESWKTLVDESAMTRLAPLHAFSQDHVAETRDLPDEPPAPESDVRDAVRISDVCDELQRGPTPLSSGKMVGTPRYLAPERWQGAPPDVRSDLYSFGVMLHELLVGTVPHPQTDRAELRTAILSDAVRPIRERAPDAHPALARLVMHCLALDPHERPGSAASIAHELAGLDHPGQSATFHGRFHGGCSDPGM